MHAPWGQPHPAALLLNNHDNSEVSYACRKPATSLQPGLNCDRPLREVGQVSGRWQEEGGRRAG
jgi:hypothetical protein